MAGDIRKCVTGDGQVTITDDVCPEGSRVNKVISTYIEAPVEPVIATVYAQKAEPVPRPMPTHLPVRYVNLAKPGNQADTISLDTATLRAARTNLRMASSLRGQRIALLQ